MPGGTFGGQPHFKQQGIQGPGKYAGSNILKLSKYKGGKFNLGKTQELKNEGPNSTQYFGLGRCELNLEAANKFSRD